MRAAILDDYQGVALQHADWTRLDLDLTVFRDPAPVDALAPFAVIVAMRERTAFPGDRLQRLPNLKLLVTTGMRNASIDVEAARELGITVCGTGSLGSPTSELTWGLILALLRHIPAEDAGMRTGGWQHTIGPGLAGRTLGVIGLGRLGTAVAAVGRAFGMDVLAWSRSLTPERAAAAGATAVSKEELLRRSDVVTVHVTLSDASRGLIGAGELALMKPTAHLVNTSRGPIIDEAALLDALHAGRIAGAGLDVYDIEPLPADHPLRSAPNTVLTPHIGYVTSDNYDRFYGDAVECVERWLAGDPVRVL